MRRAAWAAGVVAAVLGFGSAAMADETVMKNDKAELKVGAMTQALGFGQRLDDAYKSDNRVYLFMKSARLRLNGTYERIGFNLEMGLGPEDGVLAPNPGIALGLKDLSFDIPVTQSGKTYLKVGQFKVPYGREQLTYAANTTFAERSVENTGIVVGRDVGLAVVSHPGMFTLIGGVFTGGGRDVPPAHYLPEKMGVPLVVARVGVGNLQESPFELSQSARNLQSTQWGVAVNGLYTKDSLVGHSTVLNVKGSDKSILLNGNWNPYIGKRPLDQGEWMQGGADAVVRAPVGGGFSVGGEAQVDYAAYSNKYGKVQLTGARAQGSVAKGPVEVALRYGAIVSDPEFKVGETAITGKTTIHEITPSVSYSLFGGDKVKVVADLPVLLNAPVISEENVGAYVGTELPDEAALLSKNGSVSNQNVVEGRLMFQARF